MDDQIVEIEVAGLIPAEVKDLFSLSRAISHFLTRARAMALLST